MARSIRVYTVVTGAVRTTPVEAMQLYTRNKPIKSELQKSSCSAQMQDDFNRKMTGNTLRNLLKTQNT